MDVQQKIFMQRWARETLVIEPGQTWSGVTLHQQFNEWMQKQLLVPVWFAQGYQRGEDRDLKTKAPLKRYLDSVFRTNSRTKKYWIKDADDAIRVRTKLREHLGRRIVVPVQVQIVGS